MDVKRSNGARKKKFRLIFAAVVSRVPERERERERETASSVAHPHSGRVVLCVLWYCIIGFSSFFFLSFFRRNRQIFSSLARTNHHHTHHSLKEKGKKKKQNLLGRDYTRNDIPWYERR